MLPRSLTLISKFLGVGLISTISMRANSRAQTPIPSDYGRSACAANAGTVHVTGAPLSFPQLHGLWLIDLHKVYVGRFNSRTAKYFHPNKYSGVACNKRCATELTIPISKVHFNLCTMYFWNILDVQNVGWHWCRRSLMPAR